jgi:hypothetical protein
VCHLLLTLSGWGHISRAQLQNHVQKQTWNRWHLLMKHTSMQQ